jgi:hypothetical protein
VSAPKFVRPCILTTAKAIPRGDDWLHEPKLDGYRFQIVKDGPALRHSKPDRLCLDQGAREPGGGAGGRPVHVRSDRAIAYASTHYAVWFWDGVGAAS